MLDELLDIASSIDFEEFGSLELVGARRHDEGVTLSFELSDEYRPELHPNWEVICSGVVEQSFGLGSYDDFQITQDHVLLWEYVKRRTAISFYGSTKESLSVAGALFERHRALVGEWIPFHRFLNMRIGLNELIAGGFGRLAEGPEPLVLAYEEVMQDYGFSASHVEPRLPSRWVGGEWVEIYPSLSLLLLNESFVVAESFAAKAV